MQHQKLPKVVALPVFASDAISSSAYAAEEMMLVLWAGGAAALNLSLPTALAVGALLTIVAFSYTQTVHAYPEGGGAFTVASENLGALWGLTAAAAVLIGYVLTVAVSIAAGAAAVTSAVPSLLAYRVPICLGFIGLMTLMNLRGARESGAAFAPPTYGFGVLIVLLVGMGWRRVARGQVLPLPDAAFPGEAQPFTVFLVLTAFARGCAALPGTEAISNGVPAFRPPEARNASITLFSMALILGVLFLGISLLASYLHLLPVVNEHGHVVETLVSRIGRTVFGTGMLYYILQLSTAAILVLAANTAYADFPRLSSILARKGCAPRQLANLGDRLVFSNGILLLGMIFGVAWVLFQGDTHALMPLYALGVFLSFTLSQAGMVRRWFRLRTPGWRFSAPVNALGALTTGVVFLVQATVNFTAGAWAILVAIPTGVWVLWQIHRHYQAVADCLSMDRYVEGRQLRHRALVLVPDVHRGVMHALELARALSQEVEGVYVNMQPTTSQGTCRRVLRAGTDSPEQHLEVVSEATRRLRGRWERWVPDIPLTVLDFEFRSVTEPVLAYVDELIRHGHAEAITVVIPEFTSRNWWANLLHNQSALMLKLALNQRDHVSACIVSYSLHDN
ncbi:MAG: amino acid permease [Armatimonadetes bacterium CG17_big_fil_post_rev_8_21_14_2_50_66_6]|nr:MAG: amino acid permease [Armatimonadetes bacterium CG17_big_fil_post_rev_8_21_14_2_50_66_6]